jgi:asparagine synthase (glutamine-hydrolysing)
MCGITGGIGRSHPSKEIMDVQLSLLSHRGPDSVGTFIDSGISLGMCRLAIVEIEHGTQPATDRNRKVHIIWNGEIYNFKELGHELSQYGIILQNSSESEVLLQLYLKYGLDFINRVNGMFAIAIFDSRDYSLHLVRDRMGKKPLWITQLTDNTLFFASEIKALLKVQSNLTIRPQMISEILQYGYIKAPNSPFEKIFQLPPASITSWREGNTTSMIYWTPSFIPKNHISYEFAVKKTGELVKKAVERRLLSERPLGSFLSGGIDSTIVTAYMSQLTHEKINTFSIGFEDENLNEANYASDISKYLGANHHVAILREDIGKLTEEIFSKVDLPFADSSIIPTYFLSKFAKSELVVALTGDGGDEIFGVITLHKYCNGLIHY